jgi:hypothetical protein
MSNHHFFKVVLTEQMGLTKSTGILIPTGKNKTTYSQRIGTP